MTGKTIQLNQGKTIDEIANLIREKRPNWKVNAKRNFIQVNKDGKNYLVRTTPTNQLKVIPQVPLMWNIFAIIPAVVVSTLLGGEMGMLIQFLITFTIMLVLLVVVNMIFTNSNAVEINSFYQDIDQVFMEERV